MYSISESHVSLRNVPTQNSFMYDEIWTAETDSFLLSRLIEQKAEGNWIPTHVNCHALMVVKAMMEEKFQQEYSWNDIYGRSLKLKERYETFKFVIDKQGVWWDRIAKKVYAETTVWREIVRENSFALAYYHSAEYEMEKLTTLFGPETPPKPTMPVEVVEISDGSLPPTTLRDHVSRTTILVSDEDEEVFSPVPHKNKTRKKLIDDAPIPSAAYAPKRDDYYPPDFYVKPPKTGSSSKKKFPPNAPYASSSCDSFSPMKWFHFPDKTN